MELNIEKICEELKQSEFKKAKRSAENNGNGASYQIDGENCVSNVSFWPNGYCDVEYIESNKEPVVNHFEFNSYKEAIETIKSEIRKAEKRA